MDDHEHSAGGPGNGSGGGDGFDAREEPTAVVVSRDFVIGSLGRTANALFGAGGVCLDSRALVTAGKGSPALQDLIEELDDLHHVIGGLVRALQRLEFEEEIP